MNKKISKNLKFSLIMLFSFSFLFIIFFQFIKMDPAQAQGFPSSKGWCALVDKNTGDFRQQVAITRSDCLNQQTEVVRVMWDNYLSENTLAGLGVATCMAVNKRTGAVQKAFLNSTDISCSMKFAILGDANYWIARFDHRDSNFDNNEITKACKVKPVTLKNLGITCDGRGGASEIPQTARSFMQKVVYNKEKRGYTEKEKLYLDCSSYAAAVLGCVGLPNPGTNSTDIFSASRGGTRITNMAISPNGTSVVVNGRALKVGDLIGWPWPNPDCTSRCEVGHVLMYIGNGKIINVQGPTDAGGTVEYALRNYPSINKINHIKRL